MAQAESHMSNDDEAGEGDEGRALASVSVDEPFIPVRRDGLASRDTDDGLVLFTPEGDTVRLNSTASILWQFFDGQVTVGELIDDIAAVYDLSRGEVAPDVIGVVADLAARRVVLHPDVDLGPDPTRRSSDGARYRPDGCTPCGQHLEERAWEAKSVVRLGGHHLGIRSSHQAIDDALRELLADHLVDDPDAPNDFSIWLETDESTGAVTIDLYDYHSTVWRSGSMQPIRRALLAGQPTPRRRRRPPSSGRSGDPAPMRRRQRHRSHAGHPRSSLPASIRPSVKGRKPRRHLHVGQSSDGPTADDSRHRRATR